MKPPRSTVWVLLLAACAAAQHARAQPAAHVHGQAQANVAVQGAKLSVQLELPLDSLGLRLRCDDVFADLPELTTPPPFESDEPRDELAR